VDAPAIGMVVRPALKLHTGIVDVVMVTGTAAVASYTFQFHAEKIAKTGQG
jgi:hypothetical protein